MSLNGYDLLDYQRNIEDSMKIRSEISDKYDGYPLFVVKHLNFNKQLGLLSQYLDKELSYWKTSIGFRKKTMIEQEYYTGLFFLLSIAVEQKFFITEEFMALTSYSFVEQLFLIHSSSADFNRGNYNQVDFSMLFYNYLGLGKMLFEVKEGKEIIEEYINYDCEILSLNTN